MMRLIGSTLIFLLGSDFRKVDPYRFDTSRLSARTRFPVSVELLINLPAACRTSNTAAGST